MAKQRKQTEERRKRQKEAEQREQERRTQERVKTKSSRMDDLDYLRLGLGDSYYESGRVFRRTRAREHLVARDPSMPRLLPLYSTEALRVLEASGKSVISSASRSEDMPGLYSIVESMPGLYRLVESENEVEEIEEVSESGSATGDSEMEEELENETETDEEKESEMDEEKGTDTDDESDNETDEESGNEKATEESENERKTTGKEPVVAMESSEEIVDCVSDSSSIESIGVETTSTASASEKNSDSEGIANSE